MATWWEQMVTTCAAWYDALRGAVVLVAMLAYGWTWERLGRLGAWLSREAEQRMPAHQEAERHAVQARAEGIIPPALLTLPPTPMPIPVALAPLATQRMPLFQLPAGLSFMAVGEIDRQPLGDMTDPAFPAFPSVATLPPLDAFPHTSSASVPPVRPETRLAALARYLGVAERAPDDAAVMRTVARAMGHLISLSELRPEGWTREVVTDIAALALACASAVDGELAEWLPLLGDTGDSDQGNDTADMEAF